jgi:dihydrofolate reductase
MRKVIAAEHVTLDGLFAGPNGEIDWFKPPNKEMAKYAINQLGITDTILFGRVTYEMMASYWPSASAPTEDPILIDWMNNLPKIVFSKTLKKAEWKNSRLIKDNIAEEIQKMKRQPGKDMVILGSGSIVSAFTDLGLIDEYQLFVNPIVLGKGKPLFKELNDRHKLKLTNTKTFSNGVVLLHYRSDTGDFN